MEIGALLLKIKIALNSFYVNCKQKENPRYKSDNFRIEDFFISIDFNSCRRSWKERWRRGLPAMWERKEPSVRLAEWFFRYHCALRVCPHHPHPFPPQREPGADWMVWKTAVSEADVRSGNRSYRSSCCRQHWFCLGADSVRGRCFCHPRGPRKRRPESRIRIQHPRVPSRSVRVGSL